MVFTRQKNYGYIYRTRTKGTISKIHTTNQKEKYMLKYKKYGKKKYLFKNTPLINARYNNKCNPLFLFLNSKITESNEFSSHIDLLLYDNISITQWKGIKHIIYKQNNLIYIADVTAMSYNIKKPYKLIRFYVSSKQILNYSKYAFSEFIKVKHLTF